MKRNSLLNYIKIKSMRRSKDKKNKNSLSKCTFLSIALRVCLSKNIQINVSSFITFIIHKWVLFIVSYLSTNPIHVSVCVGSWKIIHAVFRPFSDRVSLNRSDFKIFMQLLLATRPCKTHNPFALLLDVWRVN